jgi:hypothetical protein
MNLAEFATSNRALSVLIVAYRRWDNIAQILKSCQQAGIGDIFLTLDAPNENDQEAWDDQAAIKKVVSDFEVRTGRSVKMRVAKNNQGCAVNVILGCEWAFQSAEYLTVLEDDCLPSLTFFDFCRNELPFVRNDKSCWLLCGSQFAPVSITKNRASLSRYALTWGWATHKSKWLEMRKSFFSPSKFPEVRDFLSALKEDSFWNAGARRAIRGYTDVWDTVLLQRMQYEKKYAILPPQNLVENTGNDHVSTHTESNSPWVGRKVMNVGLKQNGSPVENHLLDKWLSHAFYKIRFRHVISTKATLILDLIFYKYRRKFKSQLKERLGS